MKNTLGDKFRDKVKFVKPLYRKTKVNRVRPRRITFLSLDEDATKNLVGNGKFDVENKTNIILVKTKCLSTHSAIRDRKVNVDGLNKGSLRELVYVNGADGLNMNDGRNGDHKMLNLNGGNGIDEKSDTDNKEVQACEKSFVIHKLPDTWLRIYPASTYTGESTGSIAFRCTFCQLGLIAILVIWTLIWAFVIYSFEGPYEVESSLDFEKKQNQLVIDLATELRQITPLSTRWREAIENRIEEERRLTMKAVARGAKINPGRFWDPSGTFLFIIYVMTALGFGAPVPQTIWGRTSVLVYAAIAIPTHVFLMLNTSTCIVIKLEKSIQQLKIHGNTECNVQKTNLDSNQVLEASKPSASRKIVKCLIKMVVAFHCIPQVVTLYYVIGALSFGVSRHKEPWDIIMFPLEFTTSGGLEHVEGHVRLVYGIYVEGAMVLLACILAILRRHSNATRTYMCNKYNLFDTEKCSQCDD